VCSGVEVRVCAETTVATRSLRRSCFAPRSRASRRAVVRRPERTRATRPPACIGPHCAPASHQPRHHLDLPAGHRQHRDHRHRPRPPRPHGARPQLASRLIRAADRRPRSHPSAAGPRPTQSGHWRGRMSLPLQSRSSSLDVRFRCSSQGRSAGVAAGALARVKAGVVCCPGCRPLIGQSSGGCCGTRGAASTGKGARMQAERPQGVPFRT